MQRVDGLAAAEAERRPNLVLDPVLLVLALAAAAGLAVALLRFGVPLHPAQQALAVTLLLLVLVAIALAPANGLVLLFLLPPLFNGEDQRPYFWLLEAFVSLTLLAGFGVHLWRRRRVVFPYAPLVLLFLLSTIVSFPLALRELVLEVQVSSWRDLLDGVRRADLQNKLFYVRTVLNVASGIGLYVLVATERWSRDRLVRLAGAAMLLYVAVVGVGLWLYWLEAAPKRTFLSVWLGGRTDFGGFAGLGFNVSYFAQYALAYLPLAGLVLTEPAPRWMKTVALGGLLISAYAVLATLQRGAYVILLVMLGLLLAAGLGRRRRAPHAFPHALTLALCVFVLVFAAVVVFSAFGARAQERVLSLWQQGDWYRMAVHRVAWRMFLDEPLLGIGSGQFASLFPQYDPDPQFQDGSLSAHDLYAQLLSEQGLLGLGSFLAMLASVTLPALRAARGSPDPRPPSNYLLISMVCWLCYGALQYTFLMRSMQIYFWISLGLLAGLASTGRPTVRLSGRGLAVVVVVLVILVAHRVDAVVRRPIPTGYAWGFHAGAVHEARWTRGVAVLNLLVQAGWLRLAFDCPIPQVADRPQQVTIHLDGKRAADVILDSPGASRTVDLLVDREPGGAVLVEIRVAYTFVPAALGHNADGRRLGVLMQPPAWLTAPRRRDARPRAQRRGAATSPSATEPHASGPKKPRLDRNRNHSPVDVR